MRPEAASAPTPISRQSLAGLNAANFFLAEVVGVVLPFVSNYLRDQGWSYSQIGAATAIGGLGLFLFQAPAGWLFDRSRRRRLLLASASLAVGLLYGWLPAAPVNGVSIAALLFLAGAAQACFTPALGALALGLAGHERLNSIIGGNQAWNHAGNIAAAVGAMALVSWFSLTSVFYAVMAVSVLAAGAVLLIRPAELKESRVTGQTADPETGSANLAISQLLADRRVRVLFVSTALFHLANAPVMPMVALDVKHLGGSEAWVAAVVLVAQVVMIPVALAAGRYCETWGRKPVFAIGFAALPVRIFLYSLAGSPQALVTLQILDGIGAGIYGVAVVAMSADLTRDRGGFNSLAGLLAAALALGGVIGPLSAGFLVQRLGFSAAYCTFALVALAAAALFCLKMPETKPGFIRQPARARGDGVAIPAWPAE